MRRWRGALHPERRDAMALDADVVRLARGKNLATVVTLMPDGQPQALLTWVDIDGEHLLVNTEPRRQRGRNVARDPRSPCSSSPATTPTTGPKFAAGSSGPSRQTRRGGTSTSCTVGTRAGSWLTARS